MSERRLALIKENVALWPFLAGCFVGVLLLALVLVVGLTVSWDAALISALSEFAVMFIAGAFLAEIP